MSLVWITTYHPQNKQPEKITYKNKTPRLTSGQKLKILTWNIQFMAGKNYVFFFDVLDSSGPDIRPTPTDITATLKEVARVIKEENPDIILLQELDDGAKRTDYEDQLSRLLALLPKDYACYTSTFYWKAAFVPHPHINGAVGMKLAIISKYDIQEATRYQLALIPANILVQQLALKRAVLETKLPLTNGKLFALLCTHLDAFAQGTNTMETQVNQVKTILDHLVKQNIPFVIGGDFNLLPPGIAFESLPKDQNVYFNPRTEILPLFQNFQTIPSIKEANGPQRDQWFSHFPNDPAVKKPDRTIDYFILSRNLQITQHYIRQNDTLKISDHLPIITEVIVP